ncbi:hypothetical protein GCM10007377_05250 [Galliscardovia ingluviei]|uniref:Uncharacterized protein n=1 Tax=Galliscardovia ingluviei TaxID=1769422 RepID=A0A8J3F1F3_9BIFI|nr:hypothetical protein GCM10007377_05250 [Galliscardovia ingluviei]
MVNNVIASDRVQQRHPEINKFDVQVWRNIQKSMRRNTEPYNYVAVGIDDRGRQLEVIAF